MVVVDAIREGGFEVKLDLIDYLPFKIRTVQSGPERLVRYRKQFYRS